MQIESNQLFFADIVICSYLGKDKDLQRIRFDDHLKQRDQLHKFFPKMQITTLCSAWPHWARDEMEGNRHDFIYHKKRMLRPEKHRMIYKSLYSSPILKTILVLDDDSLPIEMPDIKAPSVVKTIRQWISRPEKTPAPCIFFSLKGSLNDIYYNAREPVLKVSPWAPCGTAIILRSDFGILIKSKDCFVDGKYIVDDCIMRGKAAAKGKLVLKHCGLFFTHSQSLSSDKYSTCFADKKERKESLELTKRELCRRWPEIYTLSPKGRLQVIWNVKGREMRSLIGMGALHKTEYGLVPVPSVLKEYREKRAEGRRSLIDLLE